MIYFDNAATGGRKPDCVVSAVSSAAKLCANPGRSGHKLSLACASAVLDCRNALSEYFGPATTSSPPAWSTIPSCAPSNF